MVQYESTKEKSDRDKKIEHKERLEIEHWKRLKSEREKREEGKKEW